MTKFIVAVLLAGCLTGCAAQPESQAQQADDSACTAQADAVYNAQNVNLEGRPSENGLRYPASPTEVFQGQQMGSEHERDTQITNCEEYGNDNGQNTVNGVPVVTPHIISTP
jgi:hypothetical protein